MSFPAFYPEADFPQALAGHHLDSIKSETAPPGISIYVILRAASCIVR
jgi:hypothetical protein